MKNIEDLKRQLPLLGHRNWILIVDKAYPYQSASGIEYIDTGEGLVPVLDKVLQLIKSSSHIRPVIYLDKELSYLSDDMVSGVDALKEKVYALTASFDTHQILHDEVFGKLDAASKLFNVVVVKTESLIPYTSVFIELDCGYWPSEKEKQLRDKMLTGK